VFYRTLRLKHSSAQKKSSTFMKRAILAFAIAPLIPMILHLIAIGVANLLLTQSNFLGGEYYGGSIVDFLKVVSEVWGFGFIVCGVSFFALRAIRRGGVISHLLFGVLLGVVVGLLMLPHNKRMVESGEYLFLNGVCAFYCCVVVTGFALIRGNLPNPALQPSPASVTPGAGHPARHPGRG
jgi:hypothetical protein